MSEVEVVISCQGGKKVIMKFIGSVFMCHPFYKTFQFLGNNWGESIHLLFPFVFSSWAFSVKFSWVIVRAVIEVINGEVLVVLHPLTQLIKWTWPESTSGLSGRCPEVAAEISPWIWGRSLARFHPLVFRECW